MSARAFATNSLADPPEPSVIAAALGWIEATLLGTVATIVAILAVSSIGFMMLAGRIDLRRGLTVIVGSFILFGASSIVAGLGSLPSRSSEANHGEGSLPAPAPAPAPLAPSPGDHDPYAGASVARP